MKKQGILFRGAIISIVIILFICIAAGKTKMRLNKATFFNKDAKMHHFIAEQKSKLSRTGINIGYAIFVAFTDMRQDVAKAIQNKNHQHINQDIICIVEKAGSNMFETFIGNSVDKKLRDSANIQAAKGFTLATHHKFEVRQIINNVQCLNERLSTIAGVLFDAHTQS